MNILLISDSYYTYCLMYNLGYLINRRINNVYVLKENVRNDDLLSGVGSNYTINTCVSVESIIGNIDLIIIVKDESFSELGLLRIQKIASKYNKDLIMIDMDSTPGNTSKMSNTGNIFRDDVPTILILNDGAYSPLLPTELYVNKYLQESGLAVRQEFSDLLSNIISHFREGNCLNKQLINNKDDADIQVITLSGKLFEYSTQNLKFHKRIIDINPDAVILLINDSPHSFDLDEKKKIFFYKYGRPVDLVIQSDFRELENGVARTKKIMVSNKIQNLAKILELFIDSFLKSISLPDDVELFM